MPSLAPLRVLPLLVALSALASSPAAAQSDFTCSDQGLTPTSVEYVDGLWEYRVELCIEAGRGLPSSYQDASTRNLFITATGPSRLVDFEPANLIGDYGATLGGYRFEEGELSQLAPFSSFPQYPVCQVPVEALEPYCSPAPTAALGFFLYDETGPPYGCATSVAACGPNSSATKMATGRATARTSARAPMIASTSMPTAHPIARHAWMLTVTGAAIARTRPSAHSAATTPTAMASPTPATSAPTTRATTATSTDCAMAWTRVLSWPTANPTPLANAVSGVVAGSSPQRPASSATSGGPMLGSARMGAAHSMGWAYPSAKTRLVI